MVQMVDGRKNIGSFGSGWENGFRIIKRRVESGRRIELLLMSSREQIFTWAPDCWVLRDVSSTLGRSLLF